MNGNECVPQSRLSTIAEATLWRLRLLMVVPVVGSLLLAIAALCIATVNVLTLVFNLGAYFDFHVNRAEHDELSRSLVSEAVGALDIYLLSAILLIFALGLYELFIGKIDEAEKTAGSSQVLVIRTLDDLKERLAKVALLALVIEFLRQALRVSYSSVLDLLYLAAGILAVGGAIYLTMREMPRPPSQP